MEYNTEKIYQELVNAAFLFSDKIDQEAVLIEVYWDMIEYPDSKMPLLDLLRSIAEGITRNTPKEQSLTATHSRCSIVCVQSSK